MKLFNGNIISVILSGRDIKLKNHINFFNDNFSFLNFIYGYGFLNHIDIIELDIFDTFFSYGLLFFTAIVSFYLYCLYINRKNRALLFFNMLYLGICISSGHIWFNTMSALFFSLVNLYFKEGFGNEKDLLHN